MDKDDKLENLYRNVVSHATFDSLPRLARNSNLKNLQHLCSSQAISILMNTIKLFLIKTEGFK